MNGYRALVGALEPKLIQASLKAMPGEEPTLDGKTQAQIWQTTTPAAPAPVTRPSVQVKTSDQELASIVTTFVIASAIGLALGGVGGALLWTSHRVLGGLLGGVLGGGAGFGAGLLVAWRNAADQDAVRQMLYRAGVRA